MARAKFEVIDYSVKTCLNLPICFIIIMWTHDKKLINAYRECMAGIVQQIQDKEDVDFGSMCDGEMGKMIGYTNAMLEEWELRNPVKISEKRQRYFTPKLPTYQNL